MASIEVPFINTYEKLVEEFIKSHELESDKYIYNLLKEDTKFKLSDLQLSGEYKIYCLSSKIRECKGNLKEYLIWLDDIADINMNEDIVEYIFQRNSFELIDWVNSKKQLSKIKFNNSIPYIYRVCNYETIIYLLDNKCRINKNLKRAMWASSFNKDIRVLEYLINKYGCIDGRLREFGIYYDINNRLIKENKLNILYQILDTHPRQINNTIKFAYQQNNIYMFCNIYKKYNDKINKTELLNNIREIKPSIIISRFVISYGNCDIYNLTLDLQQKILNVYVNKIIKKYRYYHKKIN